MIESVLFILEDIDEEHVLAVLGALQAYETAAIEKVKGWNSTHKDNRTIELKMYLVCKSEYEFIFNRCLTSIQGIYTSVDYAPKIDYAYISFITSAQIQALGEKTNKPFAIACGIIIGCEAKVLPDVSNLYPAITVEDKILADASIIENSACYDFCYAHNILPIKIDKFTFDLDARGIYVALSKAVLGYSSFETYLGCCYGKPVFEIQLKKDLFKWSHKKYICATVDDKETLDKGIQQCLRLAIDK